MTQPMRERTGQPMSKRPHLAHLCILLHAMMHVLHTHMLHCAAAQCTRHMYTPPSPYPLKEPGVAYSPPLPPASFFSAITGTYTCVMKNVAYADLTWYAYMRATRVTSEEKAEILKWNEILRKEGLGMSRGRMGGKLTYVTPAKLLAIENKAEVVDIAELEGSE